jgi:hypothetical protein
MGEREKPTLHCIGFDGFTGHEERSKLFERLHEPGLSSDILQKFWR